MTLAIETIGWKRLGVRSSVTSWTFFFFSFTFLGYPLFGTERLALDIFGTLLQLEV